MGGIATLARQTRSSMLDVITRGLYYDGQVEGGSGVPRHYKACFKKCLYTDYYDYWYTLW